MDLDLDLAHVAVHVRTATCLTNSDATGGSSLRFRAEFSGGNPALAGVQSRYLMI